MRTERETRYDLTSSAWRADRLGPMGAITGGREQPGLGHGHDLPRRRVPHSTDHALENFVGSNTWWPTSPVMPLDATPSACA